MNKLKFTIQFLTLACFLMGSFKAQSQIVTKPKLEWANGLSGDGNIVANASNIFIEKGEEGSVVSLGPFDGTIDFDPGSSNFDQTTPNGLGIYIWKCNGSGGFTWAKKISYDEASPIGYPVFLATSLSVDKDNGDIYISGVFGDSTIDFDPGPGIAKLTPMYIEAFGMFWGTAFIMKLNSSGEFLWVKSLEIYNGSGISTSAIVQNSNGEGKLIYFAGSFEPIMDYNTSQFSPVDFDPSADTACLYPKNLTGYNGVTAYILCLNGDGEFAWVRAIAEGDGDLLSFSPVKIATSENSIYVTGRFSGVADVNPSAAVYKITGQEDMFLLKYTNKGELQWARQSEVGKRVAGGVEVYSNTHFQTGASKLDLDKYGNIYLNVDFSGPINFNKMLPFGGPATIINAVYNATALVKYSNAGNFEWVKKIGGSDLAISDFYTQSQLAVSDDSKIYLSGQYNTKIDLDPGIDSFILLGNSNDNYIAQYDTSGKFLWGGKVAEGLNASAAATNIHAETDGFVYIAGCWVGGAMDFDPSPETFKLTPANKDNYSAFIVKLNISSVDTTKDTDPDTTVHIKENELTIGIKAYPNPTMDILDIESDQPLSDAMMTINRVTGEAIFRRSNLRGSKFSFNLNDLASGIYFLTIKDGNNRSTYKLLKQ